MAFVSGEGMWASSFLSWSLVRWMVSSSRGVRGAGGGGVGAEGDGRVCFPLVGLQSSRELSAGTCFGDRA